MVGVLLGSVGPNVVPGDPTTSTQSVPEGSWNRTSREGMDLSSKNDHVNYVLNRFNRLTVCLVSSMVADGKHASDS